MPSITELKERIDLHDLAERLGLVRPETKGNYRSPHHEDSSPSLSIFGDDRRWKDHSEPDAGGSCIDLVMYIEELPDTAEAMRRLHEIYGWETDKSLDKPQRERSRMDWMADKCMESPERALKYLTEERKLTKAVLDNCITRRTVGFSDYTNTKCQINELGYGGDCAAFISYHSDTREALAVDYRYFEPEINGGLKTKSLGEKAGVLWVPDHHALRHAHTVVIVESAINALSVLSADIKGWQAVAVRGTNNLSVDWRFLQGKNVILAMDNDEPKKDGYCPGSKAAWLFHEQLNALNIACQFINYDVPDWDGLSDINDYLKEHGPSELRIALKRFDVSLVPGIVGTERAERQDKGKNRVYLPPHDLSKFWQFQVKPDFTSYVKEVVNEEMGPQKVFEDLCGFRIAALSRITIASATATMTGEQDISPTTIFAASVQAPRHGNQLIRRVFDDEELHNPDRWKKFGPIFKPANFARMLNIWERATDIGARDAVNFVGLAWRKGKLAINEGPDCYFTEPDKQCPYHNLVFPSGPQTNAKRVLLAYQATMKSNVALMMLAWGLGAHLKAFLGFWPHYVLQAEKGAGKSTIIKKMESSIGFTMFSGQSLQTEFRILTSISHTSHPVGWEELSARRQDVIDKAVGMLQENYNYTVTRRGGDMTEYLLSAPVLLAGEDVPVDSLLGKLVRGSLTQDKQGELLPENLPRFPVRQWLQWLADLPVNRVRDKFREAQKWMGDRCSASASDGGVGRIISNYASMATAWSLLCEFAGLAPNTGDLLRDLVEEMNTHIIETVGARRPWVWLLEVILGQIDTGEFKYPYKFERLEIDGEERDVLCVRSTYIIQHMSQTPALRAKFDSSPVKSAKVLHKQLKEAGVIVKDSIERKIGNRRVAHLHAIGVKELQTYGLAPSVPDLVVELPDDFYSGTQKAAPEMA